MEAVLYTPIERSKRRRRPRRLAEGSIPAASGLAPCDDAIRLVSGTDRVSRYADWGELRVRAISGEGRDDGERMRMRMGG